MQADNKQISAWLEDVRRGLVRLPRFQRKEAWTHKQVENFLDTVIRHNRPIGVLLVLNVNPDEQPFETRALEGTENNGEKCRQHLLDGQQRLTALWKAMNDSYPDRAYFVPFRAKDSSYEVDGEIVGKPRKSNSWIGKPAEEESQGYIPVSLLYPGDTGIKKALDWLNRAASGKKGRKDALEALIMKLREEVGGRIFPYLALPMETDSDDAIEVFINTNTSFVRLMPYDIAVAQFEADTRESLQKLVDGLAGSVPSIVDLEGEDGIGDLVLKIACLKQDGMKPTFGNYRKLEMARLQEKWDELSKGVKWAAEVVNKEKIWFERHLPSSVPLRVLPALFPYMPPHGDDRAKADRLVRQYLWRSFVTDWYERQANDRLKKDYDVLKRALEKKTFNCPDDKNNVFGSELPNSEKLLDEGWPTGRGILKRAILAVCLREGARDVASDREISREVIRKSECPYERQYHHVFPEALLGRKAKESNPNRALNCMLLEEPTNNAWRDQWPGDYILERIRKSGLDGDKAVEALRSRLNSHLVPPDLIINAVEGTGISLARMYDQFRQQRAAMIMEKIEQLCKGNFL